MSDGEVVTEVVEAAAAGVPDVGGTPLEAFLSTGAPLAGAVQRAAAALDRDGNYAAFGNTP